MSEYQPPCPTCCLPGDDEPDCFGPPGCSCRCHRTDRTQVVGPVHVGDEQQMAVLGQWVCADDCPHPDHFGRDRPPADGDDG